MKLSHRDFQRIVSSERKGSVSLRWWRELLGSAATPDDEDGLLCGGDPVDAADAAAAAAVEERGRFERLSRS